MFKLTQEQIDELIELYGGSIETINRIEQKLCIFDFINDEDEYLELVIAVLSQHQSVRLQISLTDKRGIADRYMGLDEIIEMELLRKYDSFSANKVYQIKK